MCSVGLCSILLCFIIGVDTVLAQQPVVDPRDSVEIRMDGKRLAIEYGRPSMRGRKIMGSVVPYNRVWRTGSGKATTLTSTADFQLGDVEIPRGTYTLYSFPTTSQWKIILNKQTGQWGTTYNPDLDFARITVSVRQLKTPVEHLSFKLERTNSLSAVLKIEWEYTSLTVPLKFLQDAFVASPRDSSVLMVNGKRIAVTYGRPSRRGRVIMGGVVPYGEVWRTGANEATTFATEADLVLGGVDVPKGAYSLYSLPSQRVWKLIINKQTGQWGTEYDRTLDLARVNMKKETTKDMVERLTIRLDKTNERSGVLTLMWERTKLTVGFLLKE